MSAPIPKEDRLQSIFCCVALHRKHPNLKTPLMVSTKIPSGSRLATDSGYWFAWSLSTGKESEVYPTTIVLSAATNKMPPGEKEENFTGEEHRK